VNAKLRSAWLHSRYAEDAVIGAEAGAAVCAATEIGTAIKTDAAAR
jgi:hypothetical protein